MTLVSRGRLWVAGLLLPFIAAALACGPLGGTGVSGSSALTQAAATITAAAATGQAALATLAPTASKGPTELVVATLTPTSLATGTPTAAKPSTGTPTLAAKATGTPTAAGVGAVVLDPCTLSSTDEAAAVVGVAIGTPNQQGGGCLFADAAAGNKAGLFLYALPASESIFFFQHYTDQLKSSGAKVDPAAEAKLNADIAAGEMVAAVNDLAAMAVGQAKYKAEKVDGLGGAALWSWNSAGFSQQGIMVTANPGVVVGLVLLGDASRKEADTKAAAVTIAMRILAHLPAKFTVAGLQVQGSGAVIEPCSLASDADAEMFLASKVGAGAAAQGACEYRDLATRKLLIRVFALPPGASAHDALESAASTVLTGAGQTFRDKLTADEAAGDLVAAVNDLAGSRKTTGSLTMETVPGLGDASMIYINVLGSNRISIMLAAKPGQLVGLDLLLTPGDNQVLKTEGVTLLTRILSGLPPNFTVSGAP